MTVNAHVLACCAAIIIGVLTWFGVVPATPHHGIGLIETTLGILGLI